MLQLGFALLLFRAHFTAVGETQRNGSYLTAPPAMRDHTKGLLIGVSAVLSGSVCCVPVRMLGHSNVSPTPAAPPRPPPTPGRGARCQASSPSAPLGSCHATSAP